MIKCGERLKEIYRAVHTFRAKNKRMPPVRGGKSVAMSWGIFLKDNGKGSGELSNEHYFCPLMDRTGSFDDEDFVTDDGDYMFNVGKGGVNPLSKDAPMNTILAADCVDPNATMSNHGDPAESSVTVLLKNGSIRRVRKGDDLFNRLQKANMIGEYDTGNPFCP
jgi:hypothetical protein